MTHDGFTRSLPLLALVVLMTFTTLVAAPAWSQEPAPPASEGGNASSAGMQVASVLATIPYFACKGAFAIVGGVVGGLTYVFSGLNENAAKNVWTTSMYGTYIITPEHLSGDKAIRFLGVPDAETPAQTAAPAVEPVR
ncbi:hypothetical protein ACO9S2_08325 [Nitrospira sp. NS4]|uniref:hypothetical protein n=1 Tax=Nitrospira sp. NS4 TaxID=3414498 RepID=UPI003C2EBDF0